MSGRLRGRPRPTVGTGVRLVSILDPARQLDDAVHWADLAASAADPGVLELGVAPWIRRSGVSSVTPATGLYVDLRAAEHQPALSIRFEQHHLAASAPPTPPPPPGGGRGGRGGARG